MVVPPSSGGSSSTASKTAHTVAAAPSTNEIPSDVSNIPQRPAKPERLNLSTVERRNNKLMAPEVSRPNRPHGLEEAPTFRPTEEEFKDPLEYMKKIAPEGMKYGIAKIIPPDSWNPDFAINTERFHFRTRRQELNTVEGGTRANLNYLDQLSKFHKQHGMNLNRFPSVDKRPLDLFRLKKSVEARGGFERVCKSKKWAEIGRDLGYSGKIMSSLSTSLKNSYQKWLWPYEEYLRIAKPGVQQQLELENGGPFTPSPGPSPLKPQYQHTPSSLRDDTSIMRASAALNATLDCQGSPEKPVQLEALHPTPSSSFTPVNVGGFTPVNAPPPMTTSFTSVNGTNGYHYDQQSNRNTPQRFNESPLMSANNTPDSLQASCEPVNHLKRPLSNGADASPNGDADLSGRRSKRLKKEQLPTVAGSHMHQSRATPKFQAARERVNDKPGEACENCGKADDPSSIIVCESCECAYHRRCLDPPLKSKPDFDWYCPRCLVGTGEFGFEDGEIYNLRAFQEKAAKFKEFHFANKMHWDSATNAKRPITEDDVEKEFWRLVASITENVVVEYGADIHSTTHGSGFPTIEKQPRDPYSIDPWNLNILPLGGESLFRHIKTDISGMTVPWLYVGMVFSTFCWHNEDHYSYSANYQHFGATKTWYGIPSEDAEKFEAAVRSAVPELFETQPDLLFQLVTLLPPEQLKKAGVRVYALDQRAGQFVVTFPQAYHAGFNHGFNFNEAVNFAPIDWEPFGEAGVERLRTYRRQPCFSHDELLLTAASRDHTIHTARWLAPALQRMLENELSARRHFLESPDLDSGKEDEEVYLGPRYAAAPEINTIDLDEDDYLCSFCKAYGYLSRYVCKRSSKVICLLHAGAFECCDSPETHRYSSPDGDHVLYLRMTDDTLKATVQKVVDKARVPEVWMERVDQLLEDQPRPSLKALRSLVAEGEKIHYDLPQLPSLKRFVDRCNEWVEEALAFTTRKQQSRRKEKAPRKSVKAAEAEEREKEMRKVENIHKLLEKADQISFDCPEYTVLRERADDIAEFQREAAAALGTSSRVNASTAQELEGLAERGRSFNVDLNEIELLERLVKRLKWQEQARDQERSNFRTLKEIGDFLQQGLDIDIPEYDHHMTFFREHKVQGELWDLKAKELIAVENVHYQQLDALSKQAANLPVDLDTLAQVDAMLKKQREAQEKIQELYQRSQSANFRERPMYKAVKEVMDALGELNTKPAGTLDLEKEQRKHEDWMRRGKKLFGKANAPLHILHQHMILVMERNESCFDIRDKPRMPVEPSSREHTPEDNQGTDGSGSSRDVFCICRKPEAGMMIECELCHEWYHGKCLKIARGKVKEDDKYTCPICDWRVKIPRDAARPKLEDLQIWQEDLENLPFQPEEEETLAKTINDAVEFRDFIKPFVNPLMASPDEVASQRFYLRKVEGADILLTTETNFLRQQLHKWAPVAPEPPPVLQVSLSTRKPRPTKQQKIMAQLGITNPEDLPVEFRVKPHGTKRKTTEAHQKVPRSVQPNHGTPPTSKPPSSIGPSSSAPPSDPVFVQPATAPPSSAVHHAPSFSFELQNHHPVVTSAYRGTPLFAAHSPYNNHSLPHNHNPRSIVSPLDFGHTPANLVDQPFDSANLDPALFGSSDGPSIFDHAASQHGLNSPSSANQLGGSSQSGERNMDSIFADLLHNDETINGGNADETADAHLEEFVNHS
ncbi:hypothetical protein LTR50_005067 [Elasticomyces elasticus]|nr:hypothetical protein LTR50_005067 [Elasticomyces elasticus]